MILYRGGMTSFEGNMISYRGGMTSFEGNMISYRGGMISFEGNMISYKGGMISDRLGQVFDPVMYLIFITNRTSYSFKRRNTGRLMIKYTYKPNHEPKPFLSVYLQHYNYLWNHGKKAPLASLYVRNSHTKSSGR
jgi:hypothetical protein